MSAWMLLTLLASCLVAGAALAVEETARLLRRPARWGWIAAMAAAVGLPALFRFIPAAPEPASEAAAIDADMLTALLARAAEVDSATGALDRLLDAALSDSLLLGVWLALTGGMSLALLLTYRRLRRVRASAARVEIAGLPALLTSATGPLVVGVRRPEIVVPRWIDSLSEEERRLVLRHEWEHVRAGDPLLLLLSAVLLAAMPWNLPLWWMRRRLRQALEVDCDARVLAAGADRRAYGAMLIQTAGRPGPTPLLAPALVELPSLLERRIIAMTRKLPAHRRTRLAAAGAVGVVLFAVACELTPRGGSPSPTEPTLADVVEGEAAEGESEVTRLEYVPMATRISPEGVVTHGRILENGDTVWLEPMRIRTPLDDFKIDGAQPLYIVDGQRVESIDGLDAARIVQVEVLKGQVAVERFGAAGQDGVVQITTGEPVRGLARRVAPVEGAVLPTEPLAIEDVAPGAEHTAAVETAKAIIADRVAAIGYGTATRAATAPHSPEAIVGDKVTAAGYGTRTRAAQAPIFIRGAAKPLILVDGTRVESLKDVDPDNIEKIDVLKDASATAVYGPDGKDGVILITTKK